MDDDLYVEFVGSLRHFTRLQSLALTVFTAESEMAASWEFIATFLAATSPPSNLEVLSFYLRWNVPPSKESTDLTNGCELVLRNAEALGPILNNSFKSLLTLKLDFRVLWSTEFNDELDRIRTQLLSQSAVEEAVWEKLSNISENVDVTVSAVYHDT